MWWFDLGVGVIAAVGVYV